MKFKKVREIVQFMRKINEIFHSIQGEGCHTGVPSVFLRFSGCNLSCGFCDTEHKEGRLMNDEEIIEEIKKHSAAQIVLTGGEPGLFIDQEFINKLHRETGLKIAIETNGTQDIPEGIDWVTVSPKIGMSDIGDPTIRVKKADELKIIDMGQPLDPYFKLPCVTPSTIMLLQPCYVEDEEERKKNIHQTIRRVLENPKWRLSLQTHRFIGVK